MTACTVEIFWFSLENSQFYGQSILLSGGSLDFNCSGVHCLSLDSSVSNFFVQELVQNTTGRTTVYPL